MSDAKQCATCVLVPCHEDKQISHIATRAACEMPRGGTLTSPPLAVWQLRKHAGKYYISTSYCTNVPWRHALAPSRPLFSGFLGDVLLSSLLAPHEVAFTLRK